MNSLYTRTSGRVSAHEATPEKLVTIAEAAEYLSVSINWLYERGDREGIPCHRLGRQRRYRLSELHAATSCPA